MGSSSTISNIANNPTAILLICTISSALALSFTIKQSKKAIMPSKAIAAADAAAAVDPDLPTNLNFALGRFQNSRNQSLFTINLPPNDTSSPPKALVFLVHGVAEHCSRPGYISLYENLSMAGVDVYSYDHHGHGHSEGKPRCYVENFDDYVTDLLDYVEHCQKKYIEKSGGHSSPPVVLMGHSMGALISVMAVLRKGSFHFGGIILSSPALGVDMNLELRVQKFFSPIIDACMPKANIVDIVRPEDMSRNPEAVKAYYADPLCIKGKMMVHTALQTSKTFDVARERRSEITCPVLMLHGTDDRCTSITASLDFFNHIGTPLAKKKFLKLPGWYHELLEEPDVTNLMISIVEFASTGGKQFADVEGEVNDGLVDVDYTKSVAYN
jgi:acylglycerol lipase